MDITIITAFFNVKREGWKGFERTEEVYFSYFDYWARIQNRVIVYVENEIHASKVKEIRNKYNRGDDTEVIITGDCTKLDVELYGRIVRASQNGYQHICHLKPDNPESWNPKYNYIMLLKTYCVCDAIKRGITSEMCAWIDFGYGHGSQTFVSPKDFDFYWRYDFSNKITFFSVKPLDMKPLIFTVLSMDTYITGAIQVGAASSWESYWHELRLSMISLNRIGLMDDDQSIMLMTYLSNPEKYDLLPSGGFFNAIKEYGGSNIRIRELDKSGGVIEIIKRYIEKTRYFFKILRFLDY